MIKHYITFLILPQETSLLCQSDGCITGVQARLHHACYPLLNLWVPTQEKDTVNTRLRDVLTDSSKWNHNRWERQHECTWIISCYNLFISSVGRFILASSGVTLTIPKCLWFGQVNPPNKFTLISSTVHDGPFMETSHTWPTKWPCDFRDFSSSWICLENKLKWKQLTHQAVQKKNMKVLQKRNDKTNDWNCDYSRYSQSL